MHLKSFLGCWGFWKRGKIVFETFGRRFSKCLQKRCQTAAVSDDVIKQLLPLDGFLSVKKTYFTREHQLKSDRSSCALARPISPWWDFSPMSSTQNPLWKSTLLARREWRMYPWVYSEFHWLLRQGWRNSTMRREPRSCIWDWLTIYINCIPTLEQLCAARQGGRSFSLEEAPP